MVQTTWLRAVEHLSRIREPEHLGGWLATTARRESLRIIRGGRGHVPFDAQAEGHQGIDEAPLDASLLRAERDSELWEALQELPQRCWTLLRVLMADPPPSYLEVSVALDMPIGSIGPTRIRCLKSLRQKLEARGLGADQSGL